VDRYCGCGDFKSLDVAVQTDIVLKCSFRVYLSFTSGNWFVVFEMLLNKVAS